MEIWQHATSRLAPGLRPRINRELKQRRRRRQRERHKTIGLMSKNNRSARASYVFVHFFAVPCNKTTRNDQIQSFVENVSTRIEGQFFILLLNLNATRPIWFLGGSPFL